MTYTCFLGDVLLRCMQGNRHNEYARNGRLHPCDVTLQTVISKHETESAVPCCAELCCADWAVLCWLGCGVSRHPLLHVAILCYTAQCYALLQ